MNFFSVTRFLVEIGTLKEKRRQDISMTNSLRFSRKSKEGLKFLQERKLIGTSPEDIATFFHSEDRLDKTAVGLFLGDGDEYVIF